VATTNPRDPIAHCFVAMLNLHSSTMQRNFLQKSSTNKYFSKWKIF